MPTAVPTSIRIATRASALAQWQAQHVAKLLAAAVPGIDVQLVPVTTTGDHVQSAPLHTFGGVGVFTREVQQALLDDRADVAVHSLKDLPTVITPGLILAAVPEREVRFDALVLPKSYNGDRIGLAALPAGARIGTGSVRRQAQLRHIRSDWSLAEIRGNVDTRLRKLDAGEYDALILAAAGLIRLGLSDRISTRLEPPVMFPAVGQGAIGIECRADDEPVQAALSRLTDAQTWAEVTAERSLMSGVGAGCHAPLGALTRVGDESLSLDAVVFSPDGREQWSASSTAAKPQAAELGRRVAEELLRKGAVL